MKEKIKFGIDNLSFQKTSNSSSSKIQQCKDNFLKAALDYIDHAPCYKLSNKESTLNEHNSLDAYRETLKQFPINKSTK